MLRLNAVLPDSVYASIIPIFSLGAVAWTGLTACRPATANSMASTRTSLPVDQARRLVLDRAHAGLLPEVGASENLFLHIGAYGAQDVHTDVHWCRRQLAHAGCIIDSCAALQSTDILLHENDERQVRSRERSKVRCLLVFTELCKCASTALPADDLCLYCRRRLSSSLAALKACCCGKCKTLECPWMSVLQTEQSQLPAQRCRLHLKSGRWS